MNSKIICLLGAMVLFLGCGTYYPPPQATPAPYGYNPVATRPLPTTPAFDPFEVDRAAMPQMQDLPVPATTNTSGPPRKYTGIIKNRTACEVSVPSHNSDGTLIIPAKGWIEYVSYEQRFNVTAYHDGKPYYCMNINADPRSIAFMCDRYDFMVEIVKPEPLIKKPSKLKLRKRIKRKVQNPPPC